MVVRNVVTLQIGFVFVVTEMQMCYAHTNLASMVQTV